MTRAFHVVVLLLAALSSACSADYSVAKEECLVRVLPHDDALLILEVQSGISGTSGAASDFAELLHGAKRFPPQRGFICVDFDREVLDKSSELELAEFREFAANVRVEAASLFRDDRGQLCFLRRTRIDHLRRTLEITNAYLNREMVRDQADQDRNAVEFQPKFPIYDRSTRDGIRSAAASGHPWLTLRDGALALDCPMSDANAGRCLNALAGGEVEGESALMLAQASSVRIADARVLLRFGEAHKPVVRFGSDPKQVKPEAVVDEPLMMELRKAGAAIGDAAGMERMRSEFESVPASTPAPK